MYVSHNQTVEASKRWLNMAIAYQMRAEKLSKKFNNPSDYPDSVFACYRGYARCIQMYDACWSHIDAMNASYFRKKDYEEQQIDIQRKNVDKEVEKDDKFIRAMIYLLSVLTGLLLAASWILFVEWITPHII